MKNSNYMALALNQAKIAKRRGDRPFGAVIVCKDAVIAKGGCNDETTGDVTDHAEIIALRKACRKLKKNNLSDCTIYCTNEPCPMCAAALFQAKIPQVVIGLTRDDLPQMLRPRKIRIKDLAKDSGYEISIKTGVLRKQILKEFDQ